MKKLSLAVPCLFVSLLVFTQNTFKIQGKIERLSKSHTLIIAGNDQFTAQIQDDGSFEIIGEVTKPGLALIKTDSSGADGIWLEAGNYIISCKEIILDSVKGYLFRTPGLKGPKDGEIYHGFFQPQYYPMGSTREEKREYYKKHCTSYIDSIFKNNPDSRVLPDMIRLSRGNIGDDATETYHSFLSPDQKDESGAKQLEYYFRRKEKIKKEKLFENFSMKTTEGKDFQLSSLTGKKLILVDFWSSDCLPCRRNHVKLVELYAKYAAKGLEIVSISLDDNKANWLKAIEKDKMTWINVSELKGWNTELALNYFIKSLPYALWLEGNREIIGAELSKKEIENYLK